MQSLTDLHTALSAAKQAESEARNARLAIESQILEHPAVAAQVKDEGTATIDKIVKVTTGYSRTWDAAVLHSLAQEVEPAFWPFKAEWKEDRAMSRRIEEAHPDLWERIREALTVKPKKPSISLIEIKD